MEAASPGLPRVIVGNKADGEPQVRVARALCKPEYECGPDATVHASTRALEGLHRAARLPATIAPHPLALQVAAAEALAFAQKHNCKYFEAVALSNEQARRLPRRSGEAPRDGTVDPAPPPRQVSEAFSSLIARIVAQIPNPPEPSLLLRKRIKIGKQLAENKSFRAALFDLPTA